MTDIIISAPIAASRPLLGAVTFPKLGIRAALSALARGFGRAHEMAYVDPFRISMKDKAPAMDADLEGRDPNW